ncbi:hypothetical protein [Collimonas humicola]|uniref:hypothetical protein n=1 Tax=Collimonas humicola TaxID=2825886 RepID=UPI001B8B29EA|nr:hypothetical protein [Collimonas humicola]
MSTSRPLLPKRTVRRGGRLFLLGLTACVQLIRRLFNLSHVQMQFPLLNGPSFQRFVRLRVSSQMIDASIAQVPTQPLSKEEKALTRADAMPEGCGLDIEIFKNHDVAAENRQSHLRSEKDHTNRSVRLQPPVCRFRG